MASNNSKIWELMGINALTGEGTYKNRMGLGNAITRDNGIPLDLSSLHATFNDAVVYAATKGIAYVGQILAAGDTVYVLTEQSQGKQKITSYRDSITGKLVTLEEETEYDVYLKPVGIIPTGSDYIDVDENGKITYTGPIYAPDNITIEFAEDDETQELIVRVFGSDKAANATLPMLEEVGGKKQLVWKTLQDIGAGDGNSVTTIESLDNSLEIVDEKEEGFEGHKYKANVKIADAKDNRLKLISNGLSIENNIDDGYEVTIKEVDGRTILRAEPDAWSILDSDEKSVPTADWEEQYELDITDIPNGQKYIIRCTSGIEVADRYLFKNTPGLYVAPQEQTDYTVSVTTENPESGNFKHYIFNQCGNEIAHIDIPKDLVVESGKVEVKAEAGAWGEAGTYIVLTIANQTEPIYINAKDLVDLYDVEDTTTVDMSIDANNKIKAEVKISAEAGNSLVAKEDGLYVTAKHPDSADEAVANQYVTAVDQKDGKITVSRKQISYNELADLPTIPGEADFGVLSVTGKDAIAVTEGQNPEVSLVLDNSGNVVLTQSATGLKADIALDDYAKKEDLPELVYIDDTATEKTKAVNSELAIINIVQKDFILTEHLGEFVTANILKDGTVDNGGGLVDHTKVYAEQATWVAAEDGKSAKKEMVPSTLDQVLALATAETVTVGTGEDAISFRTGHAGLMTPEEKFKLEKLVIDADGSVGISGTISADNVIGLPEKIEDAVKVKDVKINGTSIIDTLTKTADIPLATVAALGVVKSSAENTANKITVESDGTMKATKITTDILADGEDELILCGGNASLTKAQA